MEPSDSVFLALINIAEEKNDNSTQIWARRNLAYYYMEVKEFDKALGQIDILESYLRNGTLDSSDYLERMRIPYAKGVIAISNQQLDVAESNFKETKALAAKAPDYWVQASSLLNLANISRSLGRNNDYLNYLNQVLDISNERNLLDILIDAYAKKAAYLQEIGDYKEAIECLKNSKTFEDDWNARKADFNAENFLLLKEKEQLAAEKVNQELALEVQKQHSKIFVAGMIASLIIAFLLLLGFVQRSRGMKKISAQKTTIEKQKEQLQNLDKAKSRFFSNISHEFRTPLTLISGPVAQLINSPNLSEQQKSKLDLMYQNARKLSELINKVLDLRKLESGNLQLNPEPVNLTNYYNSLAAQFESLSHQNGTEYSYDCKVPENSWVLLDKEIFRQILFNLLSNAFKFTGHKDAIKSKLTLEEGTLRLSVKDTGRGIHPEDIPHLFDRYFQTSKNNSLAEGGTGLGLSLCHEYAQLLGGDIVVESTVGKGTSFHVWFPVELAKALENIDEKEVIPEVQVSKGNITEITSKRPIVPDHEPARDEACILIVEDNDDLRNYIKEMLHDHYLVVSASNGKEALEKLADFRGIQLVISDLMMPVMDGFQLLKKIKSSDDYKHIPAIILTARAEMRDKLIALRIGVDDYLTKPFEEEELLVRIENLLRNSEVRNQEKVEELEAENTLPQQSNLDQQWMEECEAFIRSHLADELFSVQTLQSEFNMSESTLLRQLRKLTGLTPSKYILELRLDTARDLIENKRTKTIIELAAKVGYTNSKSFSRSFKNRFGKLPSDYLPN